ncbi:MAG: sugar phosphate isomerase/epimerase [Spirochaetaceae bacterium]|nr:MAG: sugar phosphate isomerase/epimerase [Spirochaetaceae bacterium]
MYGVSPAFFISSYGDRFSPGDYCAGIDRLVTLGFDSVQLEVFHPDSIDQWTTDGFARVTGHAGDRGLVVSQCVGHVLLNAFTSEQTLASDWGIEEAAAIATALATISCTLLTIPIPAFQAPGRTAAGFWAGVEQRFIGKLASMVSAAQHRGLMVALEVLPGSLVGGVGGFLRVAEALEQTGCDDIGFNFDTGHAWSSGELPALAVHRLGGRITGTHLCDNFGTENLSLAPGSGSIDWPSVMEALHGVDYAGSYDIEIHCPAGDTDHQYQKAREFLSEIVAQPLSQEVV